MRLRRRRPADEPDRLLVVGLRNPGGEYQGSRHNVGEEVVVSLAAGSSFKRAPRPIPAEVVATAVGGRPAVLALPMTFMNRCGPPVAALASYFKVDPARLVLVHDDIDLPFARLRFHFDRGPGGHNGVASVLQALGRRDLWRLRLGVGRPPGRMDPADFVLRRFSKEERVDVDLMVAEGADVIREFAAAGEEKATRLAGEASRRLGAGEED